MARPEYARCKRKIVEQLKAGIVAWAILFALTITAFDVPGVGDDFSIENRSGTCAY
jgi:hypothetical protein